MKLPFVSVVIPTYNMARFLGESIASVLNQTYENIEVIVVDDGSTDNTPDVVRQFSCDDRVRYIRKENGGAASARNRGVEEARGDLIAFNDADDVWLPHKLEKQVPLFRNPRVGVVYSDRDYISQDGRIVCRRKARFFRGAKLYHCLLLGNFVPLSSSVVRTDVFGSGILFRQCYVRSSDYDFWLRVSLKWEFEYVPEVLEYHRVWEGRLSANRTRQAASSLAVVKEFLKNNPDVVSPLLARRALAKKHANCARAWLEAGGRKEAVGFAIRALTYWPIEALAFKVLAKLMLGRS